MIMSVCTLLVFFCPLRGLLRVALNVTESAIYIQTYFFIPEKLYTSNINIQILT